MLIFCYVPEDSWEEVFDMQNVRRFGAQSFYYLDYQSSILLHLPMRSLASLVSRLAFMHLLHQDFANQFLARPNKPKPKLFLRLQ